MLYLLSWYSTAQSTFDADGVILFDGFTIIVIFGPLLIFVLETSFGRG